MKDEVLELWEAMELVGLSKKEYIRKQSPTQVRCLDEAKVKQIRIKHWCHRVSKAELARQYEVSHATIADVIKRRGAYVKD